VQQDPGATVDAADIDLVGFVQTLWRRKLWIVSITLLATGLALAYALLATPWYRAEVVLIPRENSTGSRIPAQLSQLGGLASLAGINLGSGGSQEPLGVLKSQGFARRFIQRNNLVDALEKAKVSREPALQGPKRLGDVLDFLRKSVLTVTEDKKTTLITVSIQWIDSAEAADWANKIADQINEEFRLQAIRESSQNLEYLRSQLTATDAVALQQALASLIETEMKKLMLARGTKAYVYSIVDRAEPPTKPSKPKKKVVVLLGFLAGLIGGTLLVLLIDPLRNLACAVRATTSGPATQA
jgi:uncharacterized protein involved in exopolysaccharide biosynthesis